MITSSDLKNTLTKFKQKLVLKIFTTTKTWVKFSHIKVGIIYSEDKTITENKVPDHKKLVNYGFKNDKFQQKGYCSKGVEECY